MNPKCVSPTACRIGRVIAICVAAFVLLMNGARADETAVRDRYESLKKSVLPDAERRSIRSVVERSRHAPRDEPNGQATSNSNAASSKTQGPNARSARHAERDGYVDGEVDGSDPALATPRMLVT